MEVKTYADSSFKSSSSILKYKFWQQPKELWRYYIANKHSDEKYILPECINFLNTNGHKAVYDCGGMYLKDIQSDIDVIEHEMCPIGNLPIMLVEDVNTEYDALFTFNPISLKYQHSIRSWLTEHQISKSGRKPPILNLVSGTGSIYLILDTRMLYYNRLKYKLDEYLEKDLYGLNYEMTIAGPIVNMKLDRYET